MLPRKASSQSLNHSCRSHSSGSRDNQVSGSRAKQHGSSMVHLHFPGTRVRCHWIVGELPPLVHSRTKARLFIAALATSAVPWSQSCTILCTYAEPTPARLAPLVAQSARAAKCAAFVSSLLSPSNAPSSRRILGFHLLQYESSCNFLEYLVGSVATPCPR